jgi:type I restriction enzyme S subunit
MTDWESVKLKEISELITKGTTPTSLGASFSEQGINFIKSESVSYEGRIDESKFAFIDEDTDIKLKRSRIKENDILFSIAGMFLGKAAIVKKNHLPANTNQALAIIRLKHNLVDVNFILYQILDKPFIKYVNSITGQAAQPNINLAEVGNLLIKLPPLPIQQKIASILSTYDDLIENNNRRIALLEKMAESIYKEWFVRMRFPGYEKTRFVDGLPEGWIIKKVKDCFETLGGGTPSTENENFWKDGNINWFTPTDITSSKGIIIKESKLKINSLGLKSSSAKLFPGYSIMMTSRATIGAIGINTREACTNQGFITCIPNNNLPYSFIYHWLKCNKLLFESLATGATFKELSRTVFRNLDFVVPSNKVMDYFHNNIDPLVCLINNLLSKNQNLQLSRDRLLPQFISGKLSVEHLIQLEKKGIETLDLAAEPLEKYKKT